MKQANLCILRSQEALKCIVLFDQRLNLVDGSSELGAFQISLQTQRHSTAIIHHPQTDCALWLTAFLRLISSLTHWLTCIPITDSTLSLACYLFRECFHCRSFQPNTCNVGRMQSLQAGVMKIVCLTHDIKTALLLTEIIPTVKLSAHLAWNNTPIKLGLNICGQTANLSQVIYGKALKQMFSGVILSKTSSSNF